MRVSGVIGLPNLGNTCYMNTALQCVVHTPQLSHYFLTGKHKEDLNTESKITQGKVAIEFSTIMKDLWLGSGEEKLVSPGAFKTLVSKVDKRWKGFDQHDTEEFLSFLLSCLHDDLNRITGRPQAKEVDSKQEEEKYANAVWEEEKSRNDSVVDDLFKGLFRSKLVCPSCNMHATKFDPFYSVPVQIPVASKGFRKINVTFVPTIGSTPKSYRVLLPSSATINDLKEEIAKDNTISDKKSLFVTEVYADQFVKTYTNEEDKITEIDGGDSIFVYHIAPSSTQSTSSLNQILVPVLQRVLLPVQSGPGASYEFQQQLVCYPFVLLVPRKIGYKELHKILADRVKDFIRISDPSPTPATGDAGKTKPVKSRLCPAEEAMRNFEISAINPSKKSVTRLLDSDEKLTIGNETVLTVDWCIQGIKNQRYKKIEFERTVTLDPQGGDEITSLKLYDCLKDFTKEEILSKYDTWYCPTCKEHQQASKTMDIWRPPNIFQVSLKRFQGRGGFFFGQKLDKFVEYPVHDLDISEFVSGPKSEPVLYDLYAVARHLGFTAQSGHYTAYCKNVDGKWYHYDDKRVSSVEEKDLVTKDAYLLFYKRKGVQDPLEGEIDMEQFLDPKSNL